ncbi:MAG: methyltransferase domain-containing protein [Verrucomicrobia bacterium]|nr:methyltransferase domain-containing protein [Verrucomicrobiota bacterium]
MFYSFDYYPYNECLLCGTWFISEKINFSFFLNNKLAKTLALKNFEKRKSEENLLNDHIRFHKLFERLIKILDGTTQGVNYLDVGCGTGNSLLAASKIGFKATGLEADPMCLEFCRTRHLSIVNRWRALAGQTFNLISFWETLEHLANPLAALRACHKILSTSGVLALTIPNLDCPMVKTFRQGCPWVSGGMDSPGHLNLFGRNQLKKLLQRAGFSLLFLDGFYGSAVFELCAYFQGKYRGVQEIIANGGDVEISFPFSLYEILNNIGPSYVNLERSFLLSPILFAVACRAGEEEHFHAGVQKVTQDRELEIRKDAGAIEPILWAALQEEPFFSNQLKTLGNPKS